MKISEDWLREFVDTTLDTDALAETLTLAGLEVDAVEPAGAPLEGLVVAEVRAVAAHPDADRLRVCQVYDGTAEVTVVCGAPNVRAGMKCAFAPPGSRLPGGTKIKVSKIRGVQSNGMLCSAAEIELGDDAGGLLALDASAVPGTPVAGALMLPDVVLDIGLTPNRGDCFSALGIARDLAVASGTLMREPVVAPVSAVHGNRFDAELAAPAACARYAGRVIEGVDSHAETPLWMRERLRRSGVRCLHPLVDVTNYVMLELGQPMHAFDLDKLDRGIVVREARADEPLQLLDGQDLTLDAGTLVIADATRAVALAGVMGGAGTAVAVTTTNVFLESAYFDPVRLAGVARRYRLHTDASLRFERGVDPTMQERAIERATALIMAICGGTPGPLTLTETAAHLPKRAPVEFRPAAVERLLGIAVDESRMAEILVALGMSVDRDRAIWRVTPPGHRFDIELEADLIEEVARIHGYDQIPVRLPRAAAHPALPVAATSMEQGLRETLISRGYFEAITYSFVSETLAQACYPAATATPLSNPISADMAIMRPGLWPGLLQAAGHNINRQADDVRLFELGQVFADASGNFVQAQHIAGLRYGLNAAPHWSERPRDTDFFDIKQDIEDMLKNFTQAQPVFSPGSHPALHPGQTATVTLGTSEIGLVGALHPALMRQFDIDNPLFLFELNLDLVMAPGAPQFRPISRFPTVRRDLSIVISEDVNAAACMAAAREGAGPILKDLQLIDVYRGQGIDSDKKSLTLGLIFQNVSSTLTDEEVEAAVARVLECLQQRVGGALRD